VVGQFLLKELTKRSVLPLQVKHQHLQLDALLSQVLFRDTRSSEATDDATVGSNANTEAEMTLCCYLLVQKSLDHVVGHLVTPENITFDTERLSGAEFIIIFIVSPSYCAT